MTVIPAIVAGVNRIVVASPKPNPELLAAAHFLGLRTSPKLAARKPSPPSPTAPKPSPRVDKIFGPGNRYVTAAKQLVSSDCAIDLPAGPNRSDCARRQRKRSIDCRRFARASRTRSGRRQLPRNHLERSCLFKTQLNSATTGVIAKNQSRSPSPLQRAGAILFASSTNDAWNLSIVSPPNTSACPKTSLPLAKMLPMPPARFLSDPGAPNPLATTPAAATMSFPPPVGRAPRRTQHRRFRKMHHRSSHHPHRFRTPR